MKKRLATIAALGIFALFANEPTLPSDALANTVHLVKVGEEIRPDKREPILNKEKAKSKSFFYLKMVAEDSYPTSSSQLIPGLGLGFRLNADDVSAIDFSVSSSWGKGFNGERASYYYTIPKVAYLRYLSPKSDQSFYGGAGLAYGRLKAKNGTKFDGIVPNLSLGYEMSRNSIFKTFLQLDVSQPAIAANIEKQDGKFPGPIAELSFGAGF